MTYDVLKDFDDEQFGISAKAGDAFVPAEFGYPQYRTEARIVDGTLKLRLRKSSEETAPEVEV